MNERFPILKFLAFTVVCLGFTGWLVVTMGNISFEARQPYEAVFADTTGLIVNDAVKISGVTVGKVTGIDVVDGGDALVTFEVDEDIELTEDTAATIRWRDVFGLRFLYVAPGDGAEIEPMHRLPVAQTSSPADLAKLLQRVTPFLRSLDPQLQNQVLQGLSTGLVGREEEVRTLIEDGGELTQTLASRDVEIGRLLTNAETIFDAYAEREDELRGLLERFADVSTTVADRNDTLEESIVAIADGQEELRRFLEVNDPQIRGALDAAEDITDVLATNDENLEDLLETSGRGVLSYHLISQVGQWFNIRAVGVSSDYETVSTERGATLPQPEDRKCFDGSDDCKPSSSEGDGDDGSGASGAGAGTDQADAGALSDVFRAPSGEGR